MNTQTNVFTKTVALATLTFLSLGILAQENKSYFTVEFGQVIQQFTNMYGGPSFQFAVGYQVTHNYGFEFVYEYSPGGTEVENFWRNIEGPANFDVVNMFGVLGTAEWKISPRTSIFTKLGTARGKAEYSGTTPNTLPSFGRLTEFNAVLVLGIAKPIRENFDLTFSVKEKLSANFFALGDSFDSSTVSVGFRHRW